MPKFLLNRWHGRHVQYMFVLLILLSVALSLYEWRLGVLGFVATGVTAYFALVAEKAFRKQLNRYVATLSYRVKKAGNEVFNELPIGIVLFGQERQIEWHNAYVERMAGKGLLVGASLADVFPALKEDRDGETEITVGDRVYRATVKADQKVIYFQDVTEQATLAKKYDEEKIAIGLLMLDNLEEATQGMDDQTRSVLLAKVTGKITTWSQKYGVILRRTSSDRYLLIMNNKALRQLEQSRFDILDDVRDLTEHNKLPLTLSIGIGAGAESLLELGQWAQTSLDMALGRGGDQVAVKIGQRLSFYGGRSSAVEKRTRVRARVIAHALRDLIRDSDNVIIMGHRFPDMDALGAAVGVWKAVQAYQKQGYIVCEGANPSICRLLEEIQKDEKINPWIVTPEQAMQVVTPRSLAIVVDTHIAAMVAEPKLLAQTHRIVVIDHHRRSEQMIDDATLIYMEPYASSACELVTELLQYVHERLTMEPIEATALLAGIMVDTKSFSMRTGARTFEAASFLRRHGADPSLIQRMLKEDLDQFIQKAELMKRAEMMYGHIAIVATEPGRQYSQLLIAQVADALLNMNEVMASFVISERTDGMIGISARSLGQINVQIIMERLGGGGHLTNAATQLEGTVDEAVARLKQVLEEMNKEEGLFQ